MENKKLNNLVLFEEYEEKEEVVETEEGTKKPLSDEEIEKLDAEMDKIADEETPAAVIERIKRFGE